MVFEMAALWAVLKVFSEAVVKAALMVFCLAVLRDSILVALKVSSWVSSVVVRWGTKKEQKLDDLRAVEWA